MHSPSSRGRPLFESRENPPEHYLVAHSDGGARGNPGPAGYGVVMQDESGRKVAALSEYLGHQTNNFAEYQGLIAALEYALQHGPKALKVISDSELLVRQIKGIYKVKNPTLKDLHARAKELISQLDWFSIGCRPPGKRSDGQRHGPRYDSCGRGRLARAAFTQFQPSGGRVRRNRPQRSSATAEGIFTGRHASTSKGEVSQGAAV